MVVGSEVELRAHPILVRIVNGKVVKDVRGISDTIMDAPRSSIQERVLQDQKQLLHYGLI